ncbi:MAG: hypothetical protein AB9869_14055 [Verrucomicrobiia bacterium]
MKRATLATGLIFALLIIARAETVRLDFGTVDSPVWPGFTRATSDDAILSCTNELRSFWRQTPDDLAGDGVVAVKGGLDVNLLLSNGDYRVWILSGDSVNGGYSEIAHLTQNVVVKAHGNPVFQHQRDYWYAQDFDYDPRADVWERYAGTNRFLEINFAVRVTTGVLNLRFEGTTASRYEFAFPLNALIVWPAGSALDVSDELAGIRSGRKEQWRQLFPQITYPRPPGLAPPSLLTTDALSVNSGLTGSNDRTFSLWWRNYLDKVYPSTGPDGTEPDEAYTFATPGESEPLTFCIRGNQDLGRVSVTVSDLVSASSRISAASIGTYLVRYNEHVEVSGLWFAAEPYALLPWKDPLIPSDVTRQCWLKVHVPTNAAAGLYTGSVTVAPSGASPATLPYQFQVLPFTLNRSTNASFFYFGSRARLHWDTTKAGWSNDEGWWRMFEIESSNLVAHGFVPFPGVRVSTAGAYGRDATPIIDTTTNLVSMDWTTGDKKFAWMKERGFLPKDGFIPVPCGYATTFCGGKASPYYFNPVYSNLFCQITVAIDQHLRTNEWGIPVFEYGGEMSNDGSASLEATRHAYSALKSCGVLTALRANGWVDWAVIKTNRTVDSPTLNIQLMKDEFTDWVVHNCRELWLYNYDRGRYGFGFFAWAKGATRRLHEGHLNDSGAPWDKFDGDHSQWQVGAEATKTGVAPLVSLELMSEGRDDYDYLLTLETRLKSAPSGTARDRGLEALRWLRAQCATDIVYRGSPAEPGSVEEAVNWREFQGWRALVVDHILSLRQ